MVKVSVVIPVYNVEEYLSKCLDSVINQTLEDLEIICINDGSTDKSLDILEKYAKIDDRIIIFNQENKGLGAARNRGIDLAKGKYIYFIDSDDFIELNALLELYETCEKKELDFTIFKVRNYDESSNTFFNTEYYDLPVLAKTVQDNIFNYNDVKDIIQKINVVAWNKLFNLSFIRKINARFSENLIFEDNIFFWRVLFNANRIYFYNKYFYNYRKRNSSITSAGKKNLMDTIEIHNQIIDIFKEFNLFEKHKQFLFHKKVFLIYQRFEQIHEDYKEIFFKKMKNDWIETINQYGYDYLINIINEHAKIILDSILKSNNHIELELKKQFSEILMDINNKTNVTQYTSEKEQLTNYIDNIKFSNNYINENHKKIIYSYYIYSYKQLYIILINSEFSELSLRNLTGFTEKLLNSDINPQDKIDILRYGKHLYEMFLKFNNFGSKKFKEIFKHIVNNDFLSAISHNDNLIFDNEEHSSEVKGLNKKTIFLLFKDLDIALHGLLKACFDKANLFYNAEYNVTLLNIDPMKNFQSIIDNYYELGYLNKSIDIVNIFEYYSQKNTLDSEFKKTCIPSNLDNSIQKIQNMDDSTTLKYFDEGIILKEELYISGYLAVKKIFNNNLLEREYYYTCDGFNYFYRDYKNNDLILLDRTCRNYISFKDMQDLEDYFVSEICLNSTDKPFLINDCSSPSPNIKDINSSITYKIGVVHNNPYFEPFCYGCDKWYLASLEEFEHEDAVVVLTESARQDFIKEFNADNLVVIPNFIKNEDIKKANIEYEKDNKLISMFARISPDKNISDLIKAFSNVLKVHDDAILKIYGKAYLPKDIEEKKKLEQLINELNLSNSVKFMGHVDNVYEQMSKSVATVLCSNIEGLPIVILESMINSTPVISYDTNYGPRDIIKDNINGLIVDRFNIDQLTEAIIKLLDDTENSKKMGILAKQHILDNYTEKIVLKKWENLFEEIYLKDLDNDFISI